MPTPYDWQTAPDFIQYIVLNKSGAVISQHHTPPQRTKGTVIQRRPHCVYCQCVNQLQHTDDGLMCRVCVEQDQEIF